METLSLVCQFVAYICACCVNGFLCDAPHNSCGFFPSAEHLGRKLDEYVSKLPVPVHVVRSEKRTGLIRARLRGRISFGHAIVCA